MTYCQLSPPLNKCQNNSREKRNTANLETNGQKFQNYSKYSMTIVETLGQSQSEENFRLCTTTYRADLKF